MFDKLRALRRKMGTLWWHTLLMFIVSRIGNIINMVISLLIVPKVVSKAELGAVLPLTQLGAFVPVLLAIVCGTALKYVSTFNANGEHGKVKSLFFDLSALASIVSVVTVGIMWYGRVFLERRLKVDDPRIVWLVVAIGIVGCWRPVARSMTLGVRNFYQLSVVKVISPLCRLAVILLLLRRWQVAGHLAGTLAASLSIVLFLLYSLRSHVGRAVKRSPYRQHWGEMGRYLVPIGMGAALIAWQKLMEPWVVRQRLSEADSAAFFVLFTLGSAAMFLSAAVQPFLFPLVSEKFEKGESTRDMHLQSILLTLSLGLAAVAFFIVAAGPVMNLIVSCRPYAEYAPHVWKLALMASLNSAFLCHMTHENACRKFGYLRYYVPIVVLEIVLLYSVWEWGQLRPWVPPTLWQTLDSWIVRDLDHVIGIMLTSRVLVAAAVLLQLLKSHSGKQPITVGSGD